MRQVPSKLIVAALLACAAMIAPNVPAQEPKPAEAPKAAEKAGPRPVVMVVNPVVDLGEVTYGDQRNIDFTIKNTGDDVLRIHAARSQCACAVMDFPAEIAPGAEGKIKTKFDASLSGGPSAVPIDVTSNDPDTPSLQLTIKADIKYFIDAQPGYIRYIVVQDYDGDSTVKQILRSLDGSPMKIVKAETPYDFIETTFHEDKPAQSSTQAVGTQWVVETKISPKAPIGALSGALIIHVDHPKQKIIKLPLSGFVRPMFAVTPAAADWGEIEPRKTGARASLFVKNFANEKVVVTGAETTVAGISASIKEEEAGRSYYVVLDYAPDMAKGKFSGVVRIKTESPKRPVIEVPLRGTIL
jgi:hypothetical protein